MADFVIYQTDERMFLLSEEIKDSKPKVRTHVFAPNILIDKSRVATIGAKETVVGGRADEETLALFESMDVTYHNMLQNETYQAANARLTAEGTLGVILDRTDLSISELSVLVIGFGRTGAAVARILDQVGVGRLTIASMASERPAGAFANAVITIGDFDLSSYDAVVNTVPVEGLISDKEVLTFKPSALYVELASKPALSLCFAKYIGVDAEIYPALPAKSAPLSAARAIKEYLGGLQL